MPRSGTNFLHQLLCLHPDCTPSVLWEDFFHWPAPLLEAYAHALECEWIPLTTQKLDPAIKSPIDSLLHHLGDGLLSFLYTHQPQAHQLQARRLVAKTPWVRNLSYVFRLFPQAQVVILVRDGRSVVESGVRSFYWDEMAAIYQWAQAAREILQFQQDYPQYGDRYRIVKYEDLYLNTVKVITTLLEFLNLDAQVYDFAKAVDTPVLGSSDLRREQRSSKFHWQPVEKTAEFTPLTRWQCWDDDRHDRFNQIAGQQMLQLGYTLQGNPVEETNPEIPSFTDAGVYRNLTDRPQKKSDASRQRVKQILEDYQRVIDRTSKDNFYY